MASKYRAIVARANYLAQDRTDIQFAVKELSRGMSNPTARDLRRAKRLGRYLIGKPRVVNKYNYQSYVQNVCVWSDTDYAGCKLTRKSTSGGLVLFGAHMVKSWSSTQNLVSLSSGEAEYYGLVKAGSMALGIRGLLAD